MWSEGVMWGLRASLVLVFVETRAASQSQLIQELSGSAAKIIVSGTEGDQLLVQTVGLLWEDCLFPPQLAAQFISHLS